MSQSSRTATLTARARLWLLAAGAVLVSTFAFALAGAEPALANTGNGRALGVVGVHGSRIGTGSSIEFNVPGRDPNGAANGHKGGGGGGGGSSAPPPLTYHGGRMFNSPYRVYDIYWVPAGYGVAAGYQGAIDGFQQNVAADSGKMSNVYYAATQYADGAGNHVQYAASFGGSATVTDPFPASGCTDSALPSSAPCLSDTQVANEIKTTAAANGWTIGYPNIFVVMMPKDVGNCASYSTGGLEGYCSFTNACAWHHEWGSMYFVVQPYLGDRPNCESGQAPSGSFDADQAINTISHEINESLTDPAAGAWYDVNGWENGDKCAWNFGTALGGSPGKLYNQVINGADYYLQQEWSNASSGCVLHGT